MTTTINTAGRVTGFHHKVIVGDGDTFPPEHWTTHPLGAFRRQSERFADVTKGRRAVPPADHVAGHPDPGGSGRAAKVGGDPYRHGDGTTDLGEFASPSA